MPSVAANRRRLKQDNIKRPYRAANAPARGRLASFTRERIGPGGSRGLQNRPAATQRLARWVRLPLAPAMNCAATPVGASLWAPHSRLVLRDQEGQPQGLPLRGIGLNRLSTVALSVWTAPPAPRSPQGRAAAPCSCCPAGGGLPRRDSPARRPARRDGGAGGVPDYPYVVVPHPWAARAGAAARPCGDRGAGGAVHTDSATVERRFSPIPA